MQEAEVSLRIAIYHIVNELTDQDVIVSLDGAHIKTKDTIHFDIWKFCESIFFEYIGAFIILFFILKVLHLI